MIELKQLSKIYPSKSADLVALHAIDLSVAKGQICGVIGKSGAGKSTLIRCVNLLERPTSGEVYVNGQALTQLKPAALRHARQQMGMVFQHFNLLSTRTVFENVALPLELLGYDAQRIRMTVMPLVERVGLSARIHAYPSELSGGQKQRVAIARALATQPSVLLCDEMTSALDPQTTASILALLKSIQQEFDLSVLLITHEMDVIKAVADQVVVLDEGRIIEHASVLDLFKHPQTAQAKELVHASLAPHLPVAIQQVLRSAGSDRSFPIVQLFFAGKLVGEPIIHDMIRACHVSIDIIEAKVENLCSETIGMMVLSLDGNPSEQQKAQAFLESKGIQVEVLGYVELDDWAFN